MIYYPRLSFLILFQLFGNAMSFVMCLLFLRHDFLVFFLTIFLKFCICQELFYNSPLALFLCYSTAIIVNWSVNNLPNLRQKHSNVITVNSQLYALRLIHGCKLVKINKKTEVSVNLL